MWPNECQGLCCLTSLLPLMLSLLVPLHNPETHKLYVSSLPFSGYFKPDFGFGPVVSVYQSQLIKLFVAEGSKEPVFESSTEVLPPAAIISIWFWTWDCHLVESQQLPVNQSNTGSNTGGHEDSLHLSLLYRLFFIIFCSVMKPLFSKINGCAGVLFPFGREERTSLLISCTGSWDGR